MSIPSKGLGRGLDALIRGGREGHVEGEVQFMSLSSLVPNPNQPRRYFSEHALDDLAASIRSQGLLQPILVRPLAGTTPARYEIVAGERRWRASKLAELSEVPVLIRELDDQDAITIALIENLQREDLNPLEEAQGIQQLKEQFAMSQDDLAQKLGKSRSAIANTLRLLNLGENIQKDLIDGKLFAGHGRALLAIADHIAQEELRKKIIAENLSVRETEALAAEWKEGHSATGNDTNIDTEESGTAANIENYVQSTKKHPSQGVVLLRIQESVAQKVKLPVKITGKEDKGRLTIAYSNAEELQNILAILGVEVMHD